MIAIYINGERADFFGSLSIKKDNPLFSAPYVEPSAHTYTLTIPTTATNEKIFGFARYTLAKPTDLHARIEIDGIEVFNGSCRITSISADAYSVYFTEVIKGGEGVKSLLTEERTLNEVLEIAEDLDLQGGNGVFLQSGGVAQIVEAYATSVYFRESLNKLQYLLTDANLAFEINYIIDKIANTYGVNIEHLPSVYLSQLGKRDTYLKTFQGTTTQWLRPQTSLPRLTPKELLQNVAFALGRKMQIDYATNTITFVSLNEVQAVKKYYNEPFTNIAYDNLIGGEITFAEIEPYKYSEKHVENEGKYNEVEVSVEKFVDYSAKFTYKLGNKEGIFYQNKLSIPVASNADEPTHITLPNVYEDNDKRLDSIILCNYEVDGSYYYLTAFDPYNYTNFEIYDRVNEFATEVKFCARLTPIDYAQLDMYRTILVNGLRAYVKELTYKPDGDTEISAYLI